MKFYIAMLIISLPGAVYFRAPNLFLMAVVFSCVFFIQQLKKQEKENPEQEKTIRTKIRILETVMWISCIALFVYVFILWE